jgi:UDP-N-acetylglucosamine transferase subunit ALG13
MVNLSEFYEKYNHFWITNKNKQTEVQLDNERRYFIKGGHYKRPWTYIYHIPTITKILLKERPTHLVSTGAGRTTFIPFLLGKSLKIPFFHIDTFSRVNGYSKFGSFLLKFGQKIFTQWKDPRNENAIYIGPVFNNDDHFSEKLNSSHVFVTLGTRPEPFTRMIKAVEELVKKGTVKEKMIVQSGDTKYISDHLEIFDFCTPEEIDKLIVNAKYVITQESAGIGTKCLKYNTKFIVMPRDYDYGELPAKSDMEEDLHLKLEEMGYTRVVNSAKELENAVNELEKLKAGFEFDNSQAIKALTEVVEES